MISLFLPFYDDIVVNLKHNAIIKLPSLVTQTSIYAEETEVYVPIGFIVRTVIMQHHCHSFFFADIARLATLCNSAAQWSGVKSASSEMRNITKEKQGN